jgi:hypothetical protein
MSKEKLETKALKAVVSIDNKITDITNILRDLSMKLCYIIKDKKHFYDDISHNNYA